MKDNKKKKNKGTSKRKHKYPYKKRQQANKHPNSVEDNIAMAGSTTASTTSFNSKKGPSTVPVRRNGVKIGPATLNEVKQNIKTKATAPLKDFVPSVPVPKPPIKPSVFSTFTSKVQKLIPSNVKTVIEKNGAKIVKTVLKPVKSNIDRFAAAKPSLTPSSSSSADSGPVAQIQEKVSEFIAPYRSYIDVYSN